MQFFDVIKSLSLHFYDELIYFCLLLLRKLVRYAVE